jgi:hypothetical protein
MNNDKQRIEVLEELIITIMLERKKLRDALRKAIGRLEDACESAGVNVITKSEFEELRDALPKED